MLTFIVVICVMIFLFLMITGYGEVILLNTFGLIFFFVRLMMWTYRAVMPVRK